jgi:O-antigen ligase
LEQPWIGHGFHSVWKVIPPFGPFEARHAHNEILQQFYAYGVAGVVVLFGLYGSVYREMRRISAGALKTIFLAMFLFIVIRGLADTEVFDLSLPLWAVALIGSTVINQNIGPEVHT